VEITKAGEHVLSSANARYMEQLHIIAAKVPEYTMEDIIKLITSIAKAMEK